MRGTQDGRLSAEGGVEWGGVEWSGVEWSGVGRDLVLNVTITTACGY